MSGRPFRCEACGLTFEAEAPRCPSCLKRSTVVPAEAGTAGTAGTAGMAGTAGTAAAAPPKPARTAADKHLTANATLQTILVALHVLFTASAALNLGLTLWGAGEPGQPLAGVYPTYPGSLERTTALVTYAWVGGWSLLGIFWTPFNAWGLWKRRRWARASTMAYYVGSLLACCCLPLGLYGLWSLGRKDVAEALNGTPS